MDVPPTITLRREPGALTRSLAALLLRAGLGMIFLLAGVGKFQAKQAGAYPGFLLGQFDPDKPDEKTGQPKNFVVKLRPDLVKLFADALPYAEVGLGIALIAGSFTTLTAFLSGALLLHLLFGQAIQGNTAMYPAMLTYLLVNAGILWLSPVTSNYLSLDGLFFGWFWAPKPSGDYHREREGEVKIKMKGERTP